MPGNQTVRSDDPRKCRERRRFSWRTVALGYARSRRRTHRRRSDTATIFSDWHHPWIFFLATGTMVLSVADAFFTLMLINRGAIEVNPVMAAALDHSDGAFAVMKLCLTAFAIFTLVYLCKSRFFNVLRTGLILTASFTVYACLVCYQFLLLLHAP